MAIKKVQIISPLGNIVHPETESGVISDSTTVGQNLIKLPNPDAIRFLRINANNTVDALSAANFRTAIGAQSYSIFTSTSDGLVPTPGINSGVNFLREDGTWVVPTDTLNTTGSTDISTKIYLVGASSQASSAQTYSDNEVFVTNGVLTAAGITHSGLTMTAGTNVDQLKSTTFTSALTTAWTDVTGVSGTYLATGSYIVQIESNGEYYTGYMSWFSGSTTSTVADEIQLHRAGPAASAARIYARVIRQSASTLKLQVSASTSVASHTLTLKFRRTI